MKSGIITNADLSGTHRTGTISMFYADLVELIGEAPEKGDGEKTDVGWNICRADDAAIHIGIWNYKNGPAYAGTPLEDISSFSIWAETKDQQDFAKEIFGDNVNFDNHPQ